MGPSGTLKQDGKGVRGEIQLAYQHETGLPFPGWTGNLIFPLGLGFLNFKWGYEHPRCFIPSSVLRIQHQDTEKALPWGSWHPDLTLNT